MNDHTKGWIFKFLRWFCPDYLYEEIEGDLIQKFNRDARTVGEKRAKRRLVWNVIRFSRPGIILRRIPKENNHMSMIINNIQFSFRHLRRQKTNTFIHVFGLTLGISACLLIALFIHHELSFDSEQVNANQTYRINSVWKESEKQFDLYATPIPLAQTLRKDATGLKHVTQVLPQFGSVIEINGEKHFKQEHILIAEPEFFDIFKVNLIAGEGRKALSKPYQAILSEAAALKLFGKEHPVGKVFRYRNEFDITVAGVMRDFPSNTSLPATILISYVDNENFLNNGDTWYFGNLAWTKLQASTFVVLEENTSPDKIEEQLNSIANKNINASPELDKTIRGSFEMQALRDIHLDDSRFGGGPWVKAISPSWLWIFGAIGVIVLSLACINFLNLSVAQGITRAKEVSVRKVIGAKRIQLVTQFLIEACLITLVAGMLSFLTARFLLQPLNLILNKDLDYQFLQSPSIIFSFLIALLLLGIIAGLYPSLVIARFRPLELLKSAKTSWLQQGLVVSQFTISATLAISVLLIARQVSFMRSKDLGIEKENILQVPLDDKESANAFVNKVRNIAGVKEISLSRSAPISNDHWWNTISTDETSERKSVCAVYGDANFYSVYGLQLLSGRIPQQSTIDDTLVSKVVVNEKLLEELNLGSSQEAIGKHFWWGSEAEITGVVANFNCEPLHYAISPILIRQDPTVYTQANIKLEYVQNSSTLGDIEVAWKKYFPDGVYESKFLVEDIDAFYKTESKFYSLLLVFAALAIGIACMGLWGIASFVTLRRVKEVSIRKVLGATVSNILSLLLRQFLRPVILAGVIALPLSWYAANAILSNYAYQVSITWDLFAVPVFILIFISIVTVGAQTIKTSLTNPANNLRSE
ncbi:MAG: ABC transporter permease [Chryseolinea sp.]